MIEPFDETAPTSDELTEYDREHVKLYVRQLDAADDGADWREVVADARVDVVDITAPNDVHHAIEHTTHDLARSVRVPGFRPGKVPVPVLVSKVGKQRVYSEAIDSHIGSWFWSAAARTRARPTEQPEFQYELPTSDAESWSFTAEFAVQAKPEPADWTKLEVPKREVEVPEDVVAEQLEALQRIAAELAPVEGRTAKEGDVAVIDIVSDDNQNRLQRTLLLQFALPAE